MTLNIKQHDLLTLINTSDVNRNYETQTLPQSTSLLIHDTNIHCREKPPAKFISIMHLKYKYMIKKTHRDSGNFVKVARLLVYMCPPTSMCTGALDLVSCAGVGMPWLLKGDTGDRVIMGLDMLERLSCKTQQNIIKQAGETDRKMYLALFFFLQITTTGGLIIKI